MARTDMFSRRTDVHGGSFTADSAFLTFPNVLGLDGQFTGEIGLLIQSLSVSYRQQITRLFEIGTPAQYYVAGRTSGDGSLNRVVGPRVLQQSFYKKYGDVCQAATNDFRISAGTGCGPANVLTQNAGGAVGQVTGGRASFMAYFVVLVQWQLALSAEQMVIGENLAYMFSSLDYETEDGLGGLTSA